MNANTCRNCGLNFGPEYYTDPRGDSRVCDACKRHVRARDGIPERFDEAEYRKIMGCVPFIEPDAGANETQAAMQSALDHIKALAARGGEAVAALKPVLAAINLRDSSFLHPSWNPAAHLEITITVAEARAIHQAVTAHGGGH